MKMYPSGGNVSLESAYQGELNRIRLEVPCNDPIDGELQWTRLKPIWYTKR